MSSSAIGALGLAIEQLVQVEQRPRRALQGGVLVRPGIHRVIIVPYILRYYDLLLGELLPALGRAPPAGVLPRALVRPLDQPPRHVSEERVLAGLALRAPIPVVHPAVAVGLTLAADRVLHVVLDDACKRIGHRLGEPPLVEVNAPSAEAAHLLGPRLERGLNLALQLLDGAPPSRAPLPPHLYLRLISS